MKNTLAVAGAIASAGATVTAPRAAAAHFQELIPSEDILTQQTGPTVTLEAVFTHPFENGPVMDMGAPVQFGVLAGGVKRDLRPALQAFKVDGKTGYRATHTITAPSDSVFFLEPAPYWESAERIMIVHYTKVIVDAFGAEEGWDQMVGFPVEIEPLVRPYGLWAGNAFSAVVRKGGAPVPFARVEVEWRNDGSVTAPADPFITQVIKVDANGVFTYAMPRAGWWGFAALLEGDRPMKNPDGKDVGVEMGALMWVKAVDMK